MIHIENWSRDILTKQELLKLLVFFVRVNDEHIVLEEEALSANVCNPAEYDLVRDIITVLMSIRNSFDYSKSPEFVRSLASRSATFREMKKKLASDPVRKRRYLERLDESLESLLSSDDVFHLVPDYQHDDIRRVVALLSHLSNPD